ncbi:ANKRD39 [Branchiostoma lanceolatum]|uniref:ANKRD39 protein n=1 Tax=Branchiostoma lanceolatum TaxID=7740 RepID=A0A8J9Z177_BRALA|nr:ANKRD39 [Branchiostoma lanceolatum]
MCDHGDHECSHATTAASVHQTLDELDFERGIWAAARDGEEGRVRGLLDRGTAANTQDSSGYTALHYASRSGHLEVCDLLLQRGADPNSQTRSGGVTPLHRAAYCGHVAVVKLLLRKGANPAVCDGDGKNALHKSAERGHVEVSRLLLQAASDTRNVKDKRGKMPVNYVPGDSQEMLKLLS